LHGTVEHAHLVCGQLEQRQSALQTHGVHGRAVEVHVAELELRKRVAQRRGLLEVEDPFPPVQGDAAVLEVHVT
jgi:hypothetical protein